MNESKVSFCWFVFGVRFYCVPQTEVVEDMFLVCSEESVLYPPHPHSFLLKPKTPQAEVGLCAYTTTQLSSGNSYSNLK